MQDLRSRAASKLLHLMLYGAVLVLGVAINLDCWRRQAWPGLVLAPLLVLLLAEREGSHMIAA